jgi:hypothetical protein
MKKCSILFLVSALLCVAALAGTASAMTPVRLALIPDVAIPADKNVQGLDFGLIADKVADMQGLQLSWIYSESTGKFVGIQDSIVDIVNEGTGIQWGLYNQAENFTGIQLGVVNSAARLKGLQLGLVNIIKSGGIVPFMVIVNGSF